MNFGFCQIVYISLLAMNLGISLVKHGEKKNEYYNFYTTLFATALNVALMYFGGFFS